jgi:hypothetical protein
MAQGIEGVSAAARECAVQDLPETRPHDPIELR